MEIEIKTCLADIKQATKEINQFLPDKKDFFEFQKDLAGKITYLTKRNDLYKLVSGKC